MRCVLRGPLGDISRIESQTPRVAGPGGEPATKGRYRLLRSLVEEEVSDLSALQSDPISQVLADPGGCQLVGLLCLVVRIPEAHRNDFSILGFSQPVGSEPRLITEHAQHAFPCPVCNVLGCSIRQCVDADAKVTHSHSLT